MKKPVIYSCTGCCNLARISQSLAMTMDKENFGDYMNLSGVVGGVEEQLAIIKDRPIIVIDGCSQNCTKAGLASCNLKPDYYFNFKDLDIQKRDKWDDSLVENYMAMKFVYNGLMEAGLKLK